MGTTSYAGYLFAYFTGEGTADGEQIRYALSRGNDPLHWRELNQGKPVLTSTTSTSLLPELATYRVRPSFDRASPSGLLPTGAPLYGARSTVPDGAAAPARTTLTESLSPLAT